jgi:hypothetical protein
VAETNFATFLMDTLEAHGSTLSIDELLKANDFVDRILAMLKKMDASDEKYQDDDQPPDKATVYL